MITNTRQSYLPRDSLTGAALPFLVTIQDAENNRTQTQMCGRRGEGVPGPQSKLQTLPMATGGQHPGPGAAWGNRRTALRPPGKMDEELVTLHGP